MPLNRQITMDFSVELFSGVIKMKLLNDYQKNERL